MVVISLEDTSAVSSHPSNISDEDLHSRLTRQEAVKDGEGPVLGVL